MADIARPRMLPTHDSLRDLEGILEDSRDLGQFLGSRVFVTSIVPVFFLAGWPTVPRFTAATLLGFVRERGGAGGAICEDHFALAWIL